MYTYTFIFYISLTLICTYIPNSYFSSFPKLNNNFGIEFEKNKKEYLEWVGVWEYERNLYLYSQN